MTQGIKVRLLNKKREVLRVAGAIIGGLAITQVALAERITGGPRYRVTHVRSGYAIGWYRHVGDARAARKALLATGIDWSQDGQTLQTDENARLVGQALDSPAMAVGHKVRRGDKGVVVGGVA